MPSRRGRLYVGTCGWAYVWEQFYPDDLPRRRHLEYYAGQFGTVEVNYTFYRLPRTTTYQKWASETPEEFLFALKLSRFITHIKRLEGSKTAFRTFIRRAAPLGARLGPVLVQLPPSFALDMARLDRFLAKASEVGEERDQRLQLAFEFRHPTWFGNDNPALEVLEHHGAAFVCGHSSRYPYPETEPVTGKFMYLRFHGPGEMFKSPYGRGGLRRWAPLIRQWLDDGLDVFAYFNNDEGGHAVRDARILVDLVGGAP
jgi:uncharacterized protein YecE (DUF72 family)